VKILEGEQLPGFPPLFAGLVNVLGEVGCRVTNPSKVTWLVSETATRFPQRRDRYIPTKKNVLNLVLHVCYSRFLP